MELFKNELIKSILAKYRDVWAIDYALSLLEWDLETYMPKDGSTYRGLARAQLETVKQRFMLEIAPLVDKVNEADLNEYEKGVVRVLKRELKYYTKIPPELLQEFNKATVEATMAWREAKAKADFSIFKPHLDKVVELLRQIAYKLGFENHPYNALLDLYEEGLTINDLDPLFNSLIPGLKSILEKVRSGGYFPEKHPLEDVKYNVEDMKAINEEVAFNILKMPRERFRIDVSPHPFTIGISRGDVRITTRYEGVDFRSTLFSTIHESGHALYELQIDEAFESTPLARGASMGFHESQSRFWENIIGRSRPFVKLIYPVLKARLSFLTGYGEEDLYRYFNIVRPSLIRVDADEVTYNLHIAVRYDLEKRLIEGSMNTSDLPEAWNTLMDKYLGIRPRNDAEGVLQDIHWSGGSIGYFPTYTLGNVIAASVLDSMMRDIPVYDDVAKGDFTRIKAWLRDRIHRWGALYSPRELLRRSLGDDHYDPSHLLNYLRAKFIDLKY